MPRRTKNQNTLYLGDHNQLCDVCGFKFKASDLKERWDGFMVCEDDWEPRHPMDYFRPGPEHILPGSPEDTGTVPSGWVANNSIVYSEDMTQNEAAGGSPAFSTWVLQASATVTGNTAVAPDGETTADTITGDAGTEAAGILQNFVSDGTPYAISGYIKYESASFCGVTLYNYTKGRHELFVRINFSGGEVSTWSYEVRQSTLNYFEIESIGSSWYRFKLYVNYVEDTDGDTHSFVFYPEDYGPPATAGDGTYYWGAQVERHSTEVHTYLATGATAVETDYWDTVDSLPGGTNDGSL